MKNTKSVAGSYSECKENNYTISSMKKTFGKWLSEKRDLAGLTQNELARAAGVSPSYISALEREEKNTKDGKPRQPKVEIVEKLARSLSLPPDEARDAAGYAPKKHSYKRPTNAQELIEALQDLGLPIPHFATGLKGLENVGEDELNEVVEAMLFSLSQKAKRSEQKLSEQNDPQNTLRFP